MPQDSGGELDAFTTLEALETRAADQRPREEILAAVDKLGMVEANDTPEVWWLGQGLTMPVHPSPRRGRCQTSHYPGSSAVLD